MEGKDELSIVEPIAPIERLADAMKSFERLKRELLTDGDWQQIQGKRYIKRSGFRKIALAFGLSDEILEQARVDRPDGSFTWRIRARAWAKNGRAAEGVGACDSNERSFAHLEHDVYSTAHTRAKSRAISDLVAGGAVSAEEMSSLPEKALPEKGSEAHDHEAPRVAGGREPEPGSAEDFGAALQGLFPPELKGFLTFEDAGDSMIVRSRAYLKPEDFSRVLVAVRGYGGTWVSMGRDSHFRIPKP